VAAAAPAQAGITPTGRLQVTTALVRGLGREPTEMSEAMLNGAAVVGGMVPRAPSLVAAPSRVLVVAEVEVV
jgi:hypothetical protein